MSRKASFKRSRLRLAGRRDRRIIERIPNGLGYLKSVLQSGYCNLRDYLCDGRGSVLQRPT